MSEKITGASDVGGLMHRLELAQPGWRNQPQSLPQFPKESVTPFPTASVSMPDADEAPRRGGDELSSDGDGEWYELTLCDGTTLEVRARNIVPGA